MTVTPRFIFGINGSMPNNIHMVDDKKVLYVAGHNVVVYTLDEKSQTFIPGTEGSEGINAIATSINDKM